MAARLERPDVHDRGLQAFRVQLADGGPGRFGPAGPAPGYGDRPPERRRLVSRRQRRAAVHVRPLETAGDGDAEPLRAGFRRQSRFQGRLRIPDRQQPVRRQRQFRTYPLSGRQRERPSVQRGPRHAVQRSRRGRNRLRQPEPAPRGVHPGHMAPDRPAVAEPGRPLRAAAHLFPGRRIRSLPGRFLSRRDHRRPHERRLEYLGAAAGSDVRAGAAAPC